MPRAALVGCMSGLITVSFGFALKKGNILRNELLEWAHQTPILGWLFPILFSAIGAVIAVWLVKRFAPEASGSGIPHIEAVLHRYRRLKWRRLLPVKFLSGALALGSGMALGKEGPSVQLGGAMGAAVADGLKAQNHEKQALIAAGAGAGLAAAFNAPLSGLTFVLEEVQRDFHPIVFSAAFIASVMSNIITRYLAGSSLVFSVPSYEMPPLGAMPYFAILGILTGLLGVLFNKSLLGALKIFGHLKGKWSLLPALGVGAITGLISWYYPLAVGGGNPLSEQILEGKMALAVIPTLFFMRLLLTAVSYGSGVAGGIFAPLLVLGAMIGLAVGKIANTISPLLVPIPAVFAVVGMAAYFTAIVRAPLTGILLIVEMTGNYAQMLPLLMACFFAYVTAEVFKDMPIYEALLHRDLTLHDPHIHVEEPAILEFVIEDGSPFEGKKVSALGLPPGCVIMRCTAAGVEFIPTAYTTLEAHTKITVEISPEAAQAFAILRKGCEKPHNPI